MRYFNVKGVAQPVSRLIMGTAFSPMNKGEPVDELLDNAVSLGINCFDSAAVYGGAEESLGGWLERRNNRKDVVILTKGAHPGDGRERVSKEDIDFDIAQSLTRLKTDYIDLYLLHRDNPAVPVGDIVEWLNEHHAKGEILAFGGSNWSVSRLNEANEYAYAHNLVPFTASSPQYGLAYQVGDPWGWRSCSVGGKDKEADRAWYRENAMPIMAYSSLGNGMFSGRFTSRDKDRVGEFMHGAAYTGFCHEENFKRLERAEILAEKLGVTPAMIALAYLFNQPNLMTFAIAASSRKEGMRQCAEAADMILTEDQMNFLEE